MLGAGAVVSDVLEADAGLDRWRVVHLLVSPYCLMARAVRIFFAS